MERKRSHKMKEQEKFQKELNEMEASNLSDREFKVITT